MAATGTKTSVPRAKSAKASAPAKSSSDSAAAKLILVEATKVKQRHWELLRQSRRRRVWKIAALSVGVAPIRGIRTLLRKTGRITLLTKLDDRREIVRDNLTAKADSGGLQYVPDAESDGQKSVKTPNPLNRVVDLVTFVNFAQARGIKLPDKMLKIAEAFDSPTPSTAEPPGQKGKASKRNVGTTKRNELVIGLLALYIQRLAATETKPPKNLLTGSTNRLSDSELIRTIRVPESWNQRVDVKNKNNEFGIKERNVSSALAEGLEEAKKRFNTTNWSDVNAEEFRLVEDD